MVEFMKGKNTFIPVISFQNIQMILCSFYRSFRISVLGTQIQHPAFFEVNSQRRSGGDFPGHRNTEGWHSTLILNMHSDTYFNFHFCCVSCDSQVAMERFFQTHGLVMGASQSVEKAVQTLPLIFMVLLDLLHLRSHLCPLLLHFQEMLKSFSIYIKMHQM